ncbi:MAG: ABC transporter ATP-binding protein [Thermodesulfobacteriota bacterium]|jgi:branched-chain amino acid transport system ATP-binding protein
MLFSVKELKVNYKGAQIVKGISLEVDKGEIVTLIGSNGAGKTTTLITISGLKAPESGEIWFKGQRMEHASTEAIVKTGISHIPQGRWVFPYMTVMENLMIGAYVQKDKQQINEELEKIFMRFPVLKGRKKQLARTLSGGEQQMLVIGRSLMSNPELLLMDEPSLGLSPMMVREIGRITIDINQRGTSVLLVEQNAQLALTVANKGYVMEMGNIILQGQCEELLNSEQVKRAYLS